MIFVIFSEAFVNSLSKHKPIRKIWIEDECVMFCGIWYHLYNLKNLKITRGGVLLLDAG